ncbi:uncharacterized protein [Nicotiana sylvestris]|uniref:uncharacterized protein n=1 Tax=Nicotiana sylvestris TaxID=4096 RepID=UPI00388CD00B
MKILNEAHVPDKISVNHLEKIANNIFEVNRVTFSDDELPMKGTEHNRALYLTVKYEDSVVTQALVDNGSSANICPLFTLNKLNVDNERIHKNSICVRGFDGGRKDSVGDIVLELTIGDAIVPFIEFENDKGPWVYQVFDTVAVEKIPKGKCVPTPRVAAALPVMVAVEMLKNGFVPGKGLGASLQGIVQLVSLPKNLDTFGLGFKPTVADYSFQKPTLTGRLAKWQILLTESDIVYVTQTTIKAQALADHLAENSVDEKYEPLKTYFPDEEVMHIDELEQIERPGWKLFFDGAANMRVIGIGAVLVSEAGHHYPVTTQLRFYYKAYVDPLHIQVRDQHAYCNIMEEELNEEPWFHDIKEYIRREVYPEQATGDQKRTIRRLASGFFLSGGVLYKRTPDLRLLRCVDAKQAAAIMTEVHSRVIELHPEVALSEAVVQQDWNNCRYLKNGTKVPEIAKGEVDPNYAAWFGKMSNVNNEPEPERPAKRPHVQAFDDKILERLAWGEKEKEYKATIHDLREELRNVTFNNDLQAQEAKGTPGHDTEKCWKLKTVIQELIDTNWIEVQAPEAPKINQIPLSAHHETNMIEIVHKGGDPKKPSQTVMMIRASEAKPFEKSTSEKSVIKLNGENNEPSVEVKKGSSSDVAGKHQRAKVVVPGVMNKHVGTEHNRALYLTVKCEDSVVTRALVDNGSSANICPLSTLNKLNVDNERIHKNKSDIVYVTRTTIKAQALADHLAENSVDEKYEPLKTYFPDEEVMHIDELEQIERPGWKLFFDGAANMRVIGIGAVLVSEAGRHYPVTTQLRFYCTNNIAEYKACILGLRMVVDMGVQEVLVLDKAYVDPLHIQVSDQHAYCNIMDEELDEEPWFHDIKEYIRREVYPVQATDVEGKCVEMAIILMPSRDTMYDFCL